MELSNLLFWALKVIEFFFTNLNNIFKSKPSLNINMRSIYILFIFRPSSTVLVITLQNKSKFGLKAAATVCLFDWAKTTHPDYLVFGAIWWSQITFMVIGTVFIISFNMILCMISLKWQPRVSTKDQVDILKYGHFILFVQV
jgi:hypothetical protein